VRVSVLPVAEIVRQGKPKDSASAAKTPGSTPGLEFGKMLGKAGVANSMIDVSDPSRGGFESYLRRKQRRGEPCGGSIPVDEDVVA